MKNFEPGGLRNRKPDLGGRPFSDASNYAPKKRFDGGGRQSFGGKPSFGNKSSFGGDRDKKDVTLYSATCTTCGKSCEVPFRPDGKKPVLCRDCFAAKNESPTNSSNSRERFTPNEMVGRTPDRSYVPKASAGISPAEFSAVTKQLANLEVQIARIFELLTKQSVTKATTKVKATPVEGDVPAEDVLSLPTKVRKPKKITPAITKAAAKKKVAKKAAVVKKKTKAASK